MCMDLLVLLETWETLALLRTFYYPFQEKCTLCGVRCKLSRHGSKRSYKCIRSLCTPPSLVFFTFLITIDVNVYLNTFTVDETVPRKGVANDLGMIAKGTQTR